MLNSSDIVAHLDGCLPDDFPIMDHPYNFLAAARLSVFGDGTHWALTIEQLVFVTRDSEYQQFQTFVYTYGDGISGKPGMGNYPGVCPISEGIDGPLFGGLGDEMRPDVRTVRIRGEVVHFEPTLDELNANAIESVYAIWGEEPGVIAADLLRLFAVRHRNELLASDTERRRRIAMPLPQLLQLDEWHHPDIMSHEKPSDTACFRSLAEVLAKADPSLYRPTEPPNTDWRNWPRAGML